MSNLRMAVLAGLGLAVLAGCDKKLELTFVNGTHDERDIELTVPGDGPEMVGTVDGLGARVHTTVKVPENELPATLTWRAGDLRGSIPVDKKTRDRLTIPIDRAGVGPIDKKTEVKIHEKAEETEKVHEGTIVE